MLHPLGDGELKERTLIIICRSTHINFNFFEGLVVANLTLAINTLKRGLIQNLTLNAFLNVLSDF